jgi:hypothetical protein
MKDQNSIFRRYILAIALGLMILGAGNVLFGQYKTNQYIEVLSASANTLPPSDNLSTMPEMHQFISKESYQDQLTRVRKRVDFYKVIIFGGQYLTALGGLMLLGWLIISSRHWKNADYPGRSGNP